MKKIVLSILLIGSGFLFAGCTKTITSVISFDEFSTSIKSMYRYKQIKTNSANANIQKIYTTSESGFQSSIVIAKEAVLSGESIAFANEHLKELRKGLEGRGEITDTDNINLECGKTDIIGSLSTIETKGNEKIRYVIQLYFVYDHKGYIISHITEMKDEVKGIKKGFKKIKCEK